MSSFAPINGSALRVRPNRREARTLPRHGTWELDVIGFPMTQLPDEPDGMLLIVQASDGQLRAGQPVEAGEDLGEWVLRAAMDPPGELRACRPRTIRCRKALAPRLVKVARRLGATLEFTADLPAIEWVVQSLADVMGSGNSRILPREPGRWSPWVGQLLALAPWQQLPDRVSFAISGPDGEPGGGGVAVLIGLLGEQRGLNWFPTPDHHRRFFEIAATGASPLAEVECCCVHFDPIEDFPSHVLDELTANGMVHRGYAAMMFAVDGPMGFRDLTADEEESCLLAMKAVVTSVRQHGVATLGFGITTTSLATPEGSRTVLTHPRLGLPLSAGPSSPGPTPPAAPPPLLCDHPHQALIGRGVRQPGPPRPTLGLKMAAAHARQVASRLDGLDAISIEPQADGRVCVVGWANGVMIGTLTRIRVPEEVWTPWREAGHGDVFVAKGGAKRPGLGSSDVLAAFSVEVMSSGGA